MNNELNKVKAELAVLKEESGVSIEILKKQVENLQKENDKDLERFELMIEFSKELKRGLFLKIEEERFVMEHTIREQLGLPAIAMRSQYRVLLTGLPPSASWQDLKNHMSPAGYVCYSEVFKDGTGLVEYLRREDMDDAMKLVDNSPFKSHKVSGIIAGNIKFITDI